MEAGSGNARGQGDEAVPHPEPRRLPQVSIEENGLACLTPILC